MPSLEGQTALVTGAALRVGREIAFALARAGASIVVHYNRSEREAKQLCEQLRATGRDVWAVRADLSREAHVEALLPDAAAEAGRPIDLLVNNASSFPVDSVATATRDELLRCLELNTWTPFALARAFARQTRKGHVVNLLDAKVTGHFKNHLSYIVSKEALAVLTRALALELAPGIAVNAVAPALALPPEGKDQAWLEALAQSSPLKKAGSAQDVAEAVVFLAQSRFLTGQVIYVDGGVHLLERTDGLHPH